MDSQCCIWMTLKTKNVVQSARFCSCSRKRHGGPKIYLVPWEKNMLYKKPKMDIIYQMLYLHQFPKANYNENVLMLDTIRTKIFVKTLNFPLILISKYSQPFPLSLSRFFGLKGCVFYENGVAVKNSEILL